MDDRISRADVFYFGSLATVLPGVIWRPRGEPAWATAAILLALALLPSLAGPVAALALSGRPRRPWVLVWAIVGAAAGAFIAFLSLFVVYDMLLLASGAVAGIAFLPSLLRVIVRDRRPWARALRIAAPLTMVIACVALPPILGLENPLQVYGLWSVSALPLVGASLLAPIGRSGPTRTSPDSDPIREP